MLVWQYLPPDLTRHVRRQHFLQRTPPTLASILRALQGRPAPDYDHYWSIFVKGPNLMVQAFKHRMRDEMHLVFWYKQSSGELDLRNMVMIPGRQVLF